MSDRIQRVLDGDLPRDGLGAAERAELDAYEEAVDGALAGLRSEPEPDVSAAIMRRVRTLPDFAPERDGPLRRLWSAVWRPRAVSFTLRPAWGLALAAGLSALLLAGWPLDPRGGASPATPGGAAAGDVPSDPTAVAPVAGRGEGAVFVHFRLEAPGASRVELAGDFTDWQPRYALSQVRDGVWSVVVPVEPGVHEYGFLVDGQRWTVDPFAPRVEDGFGGANSRLDVLAPIRREL